MYTALDGCLSHNSRRNCSLCQCIHPSGKAEQEALFEMLRHLLLEHERPMFLGGNFNCTLAPRLDRSIVSPPGRHDSLALRRLLDQLQLCDVLEDDMERAEEERSISAFHATAHTYFTLCLAAYQQIRDLIGGTRLLLLEQNLLIT